MSTSTTDARALFSADGKKWQSTGGTGPVTKVVVGSPPRSGEDAKPVALGGEVLVDLRRHLAAGTVTHLYLWQVTGLGWLTELPRGLKVLDLRGCREVVALRELPEGLEELVLMDCEALSAIGAVGGGVYPALWDLCVSGVHQLDEKTLWWLLGAAPGLRQLDFSGNERLTAIPAWPSGLERVELNGCGGLCGLPKRFPARLRRLGLKNCGQVTRLPEIPESVDYMDLAGTERLTALPELKGHPRTLFLYGSGVLMPPASEHGRSAGENVAARTLAYFEDLELTGPGEVLRCKLLMLGNGGAGKTSLSLALHPERDPQEAEEMGTTHGIQFFEWDIHAVVGGVSEEVHLHLWDFGGQEIYHNTHRLFMEKGAVFVVVWHPEQDGKQPEMSACGYRDEWRPLGYWIDFIHLVCPHRPRIAIVCSHRTEGTADLEARWRTHAGEHAGSCRCFYVDSRHRAGEMEGLRAWLRDEVGEVVQTQGTMVPSYWEIAQEMVRSWLPGGEDGRGGSGEYKEMLPERFREFLGAAIEETVGRCDDERLEKLRTSIREGRFELNEDRVERVLGFLTHSGWLYWDRKLFEGRVIIGQQWALEGIYAALDRRPKSVVWRALTEEDGRFTMPRLGELVWDVDEADGEQRYSADEQELLISFMEQCGLCFKLREAADSFGNERVYVSCEHLPSAKVARLQEEFDEAAVGLGVLSELLEVPRLHKAHWLAILTAAGRDYGKNGMYARDGLYFAIEAGSQVLVKWLPKTGSGGLGGKLEVQTAGRKSEETIRKAIEWLRQFLPGAEGAGMASPRQSVGDVAETEDVFVSYTWEPDEKSWVAGIPPGYEVPVRAIKEALKGKPVRLIIDKDVTKFGSNLKKFMEYGAACPHVIVVHSDKYWRSPYCIFELWTVMEELRRKEGKALLNVVIPVEHLNSGITNIEKLEEYLEGWRRSERTPRMLGWNQEELRNHATSLLRSFSKDLHEHLGFNVRWADKPEAAIKAILERLGVSDG